MYLPDTLKLPPKIMNGATYYNLLCYCLYARLPVMAQHSDRLPVNSPSYVNVMCL